MRRLRLRPYTKSARAAVAASAVLIAVVLGRTPAAADEPGESTVASELVRQAIALIVSTPGSMDTIEDKVGDALEVENQQGVDIALVRRAVDALETGDLHEARALLERSIGARPHLGSTDVAPIREVSRGPARGAEAGDAPIRDALDTGDVDGGDAIAIATGAALGALGAFLGMRWRPMPVKAA